MNSGIDFTALINEFNSDHQNIIDFITVFGIVIIYKEVFKNFKLAKEKKKKQKKKVVSVVETYSMSLFFILCTFVVMFGLGSVRGFISENLKNVACLFYLFGAFINVYGRGDLGDNWGNNVVIYDDHTLVSSGIYNFMRHPLYASIFLMLYSISFMYENYLVGILTTIIFIPAMYYRAKQEERELILVFGDDYENYRKRVGMFMPKLRRSKNESNS